MTPNPPHFGVDPESLEGLQIGYIQFAPHSLLLGYSASHYVQFCVEEPYFNPYFDKLSIGVEGSISSLCELPILESKRQFFSLKNEPLGSCGCSSQSIYFLRTRAGSAKFTFNLHSPFRVMWISIVETIEGGAIC